MEVRHPFDIYIRFWESLTGRNHFGPHERACEWLEAYFTSASPEHNLLNDCTTIVLLDEIDYLITSKQSVLYNLFDWPKRAAELSHGRRLIVIGISNTLNLVDQLMPSVQSRVGTERCVFKAYSLNDTTSILKSKIKEGSRVRSFLQNPKFYSVFEYRNLNLCCFRILIFLRMMLFCLQQRRLQL